MSLKPENRKRFAGPCTAPSAGLGRPTLRESRHVAEDIIRAAETCLQSKTPQEISTREIAALAGTHSAMVYYYFGSKDGLLIEIVRRTLDEIQHGFLKTRAAIQRKELSNPVRSMIAEFAAVYNHRPAFCRMVIAEIFRKDSSIRKFFLQQWPAHGRTMLIDVLTDLSRSGYFRRDLNIEGICTMIVSVVFFPIIMKAWFEAGNGPAEHQLDGRWIDFVSSVFESYLLPRK